MLFERKSMWVLFAPTNSQFEWIHCSIPWSLKPLYIIFFSLKSMILLDQDVFEFSKYFVLDMWPWCLPCKTLCAVYIYWHSKFLAPVKEIVEKRHGEPIKFLFLPFGRPASNEKKLWLWIMSKFFGLFFHVFMGKNLIF